MACICEIKMDMTRAKGELDAIFAEIETWPDAKIAAFSDFWYALQDEGAQVGETLFKDGVVYCAVSDDLRRAVADFRGQP